MKMSHTTARMRARARQLLALATLGLAFGMMGIVAGAATAATRSSALDGVVNINTASSEELQLLPGVGKVRAEAIVARRQEKGGFKSVDDLKEVKGIGDSMLDRMRPHVSLTGKTTARPASAGKKAGTTSTGSGAKR
jgi:competence protein ComEA